MHALAPPRPDRASVAVVLLGLALVAGPACSHGRSYAPVARHLAPWSDPLVLAIYLPDPEGGRLKSTSSARARADARVRVDFCVNHQGKTERIRVREGSGDPELDQVCAATVETWRYKPPRDGIACSFVTFAFDFSRGARRRAPP